MGRLREERDDAERKGRWGRLWSAGRRSMRDVMAGFEEMGRDQLLWPSSGEGENGRGKVYVQERGWRPSGEEEWRLEGQEAKGVKRKTE